MREGIYLPGRREDGKGAGRNLFAGKAGRREGGGKEFICREGGKTGRVREGIYLPGRREDGKGAGRNLFGMMFFAGKAGRREGCGKEFICREDGKTGRVREGILGDFF